MSKLILNSCNSFIFISSWNTMVCNLRAKLIGIIFGFLGVEVNGEVVLVHVAVWWPHSYMYEDANMSRKTLSDWPHCGQSDSVFLDMLACGCPVQCSDKCVGFALFLNWFSNIILRMCSEAPNEASNHFKEWFEVLLHYSFSFFMLNSKENIVRYNWHKTQY